MRADLRRNLPFLAGAITFGLAFSPIRVYLAQEKCADLEGTWTSATRVCTLHPGQTFDWRAFDSPVSVLAAGIALVAALTVVGIAIGVMHRIGDARHSRF